MKLQLQLQPIETAPRDGTWILGFCRGGRKFGFAFVCKWETNIWMDEHNCYRDPYYWHPLDYELPPKPKTVLEEVEEFVKLHANNCYANAALTEVLDILRKHRGETIQ